MNEKKKARQLKFRIKSLDYWVSHIFCLICSFCVHKLSQNHLSNRCRLICWCFFTATLEISILWNYLKKSMSMVNHALCLISCVVLVAFPNRPLLSHKDQSVKKHLTYIRMIVWIQKGFQNLTNIQSKPHKMPKLLK